MIGRLAEILISIFYKIVMFFFFFTILVSLISNLCNFDFEYFMQF